MLTAAIVLLVLALGVVALFVVRPRMERQGEIVDAPGVRSTLLLRVRRRHDLEPRVVPLLSLGIAALGMWWLIQRIIFP